MNAAGWNEDQIRQAHGLYEQLTGQRLSLHLERHRQWALLLAQGHTLDDLRRVITYLQREIRATRRNVGALKLSNLLQLDRFEEDLAVSRIRLHSPTQTHAPTRSPTPKSPLSQEQIESSRQQALEKLQRFRASLD